VLLEDIADAPPRDTPPPFVGSESSLTLNVWCPPPCDVPRPVVVWIHGGANWLESSRVSAYHGDVLAKHGDLVFVSLNYRLGPFGFLDVSVLGSAAYRGSHSNGLRDQVAALRWIRASIAAFGGDPDNVTLMGESAGSMDISWLLATGELQGLVRRVVLMSGVAGVSGFARTAEGTLYSEEAGRDQARALLGALEITSMEQLLGTSTAELMERVAAIVPSRHMLFHWDSLFYPRIDGAFIRSSPFDAAREGRTRGFDMLVGSTAYELGLWLLWDPLLDRSTTERMLARLPCFPESERRATAALYDRLYAHEPAGVRAMHLLGDAMFVMPGVLLAEEHVRAGGRAWMYQFTWEVPRSPVRATHAADVLFFFGKHATPAARMLIGAPVDPADARTRDRMALRMLEALARFARQGDEPPWPRYDAHARSVMMFGAEASIVSDPFRERREWWMSRIYGPVTKR
jgi:para-nitrobenzyl esterase